MRGTPHDPDSIADLLGSLRGVAAGAEARAKALRELVDSIEQQGPSVIDAHIGDEYAGPTYVRQILDAVDLAAHVHSGSGEASNLRTVQSGLLALLGRRQRHNALTRGLA